jgi:hypothetical protein
VGVQAVRRIFFDHLGLLRIGWMFAVMGAAILLVFAALTAIIIPIARHYDRAACNRFEQTSSYTTKFVIYHVFSWECLARTASGKWVPTNALREVNQ